MIKPIIETIKSNTNYSLVDSGDGEKLERYGKIILRRPDPQALWPKNLPEKKWQEADAFFERSGENADWLYKKNIEKKWQIEYEGLKLWIKPSAFKHTGLFPEQATNWQWFGELIENECKKGKEISVLNLFGYTGGASLYAAKKGAKVCHVDGSKSAINWGKENAEISGLLEKPIRWILDDAMTFVQREIKRGKKYDGIIMDPPAFGHGPNGEMWKIEKDFLKLLSATKQILTEKPLFYLINGYASGYSALAYGNCLLPLQKQLGGKIEIGALTISEENGQRVLPCGIFGRWSK
ncbi:MAG: class I SAM-dependent methyltransferase [Patescibacteria group bacterium]